MEKVDHIAIAVSNLDEAIETYSGLLGKIPDHIEEVPSQLVKTAFFATGESNIELLEATSPDSTIQKFIDKKGSGIHHIAFAVEDIRSEMDRLKSLGYRLINEEPTQGAHGKLVCFVHPKNTHGVLIELCQNP